MTITKNLLLYFIRDMGITILGEAENVACNCVVTEIYLKK